MEIVAGNLYFVSDDFLQRYKTHILKLIMRTQNVRTTMLFGIIKQGYFGWFHVVQK